MKDIYVLSNFLNNTTDINLPLKHTQRVKYTCFDASKRYLVFGASSGSLYIFQRKPCKFLQLIPNKYRTITNVSISPNERFIAFTTQKGIISVLVINISSSLSAASAASTHINSIPQLLTTNIGDCTATNDNTQNILNTNGTTTLTGGNCLYWSSDEKQFYYGNHKGEVYLITLTFFVGKTLIDISVHPILYLDSTIVQISEYESLLLVSNLNKCILCNMDYEEYKQIGNQPRDGYYGGCFSIIDKNNLATSRIFCSRPGYRIWEINLEGNVMKTHEFKLAISCPSTDILNDDDNNEINYDNSDNYGNERNSKISINYNDDNDDNEKEEENNCNNDNNEFHNTSQFTKLLTINNDKFLITYNDYGLYILDPRDQNLILWTSKFRNIQNCIVINNEIILFTNDGNLYTIKLNKLQSYVINFINKQNNMLKCINILRKNLKYFAEKTKEDYNLLILDNLKTYLIMNNQYDILNDLSVIFDSIQNIKDNPNLLQLNQMAILSTSITTTSSSSSSSSPCTNNCNTMKNNKDTSSIINGSDNNGVYILENAFCDNLKNSKHTLSSLQSSSSSSSSSAKTLSTADKHIKDMLLTVTGKFGKNIIKYKFNIFNDEEKSLVVEDLLPTANYDKNNIPFHDIYEQHQQRQFNDNNEDDEIICDRAIVRNSMKKFEEKIITEEEKTIYDLYLIWKSSKISNISFLDRYSKIFDKYTSNDIIKLLNKLELIMIENSDIEILIDAKIHCYEIYFEYLKPELLWELDDITRDYIKNGFILINTNNKLNSNNNEIIKCNKCEYPIQFPLNCKYRNIGELLYKFYQSRNEQLQCNDLIKNVPSLMDILCKYYKNNSNNNNNDNDNNSTCNANNDITIKKLLIITLNYGSENLFNDIASKFYDYDTWNLCFELFVNIINYGKFLCSNCMEVNLLNNVNLIDSNEFYQWNSFLNITLNYLDSEDVLSFIIKYSNLMPNNCIKKEIFMKCLLK